jgi:hypothetical protein
MTNGTLHVAAVPGQAFDSRQKALSRRHEAAPAWCFPASAFCILPTGFRSSLVDLSLDLA